MDLQDIQNKLGELYEGEGRKIVFWYDDDASYQEEIENIVLPQDCELIKLTGNNNFFAKLRIEREEPDRSFLLYAPFPRPDDRENSLADMFYYAKHFYSDRLVQLMGELDIPSECIDQVKVYKKFWSDSNIAKFKELPITEYNVDSIDLGILCVLANVKTCNIEELLRKVVLSGTDDNSILKKFENQKILHAFWRICERQYGYNYKQA